jgi:hypothetical protein
MWKAEEFQHRELWQLKAEWSEASLFLVKDKPITWRLWWKQDTKSVADTVFSHYGGQNTENTPPNHMTSSIPSLTYGGKLLSRV